MRLWLAWFAALVLWVCGCGAAIAAPDAQSGPPSCSDVVDITRAERTVFDGDKLIDRAEVDLPDRIPSAWRSAAFRLSYRLTTGACADAGVDRAILLFRVGGPYRISADGKALDPLREGARAAAPYNGRAGGAFSLDGATSKVDIDLVTLPNVSAGVIRASVGPPARVFAGPGRGFHRWHQFMLVISAILAMAGVLGLLVAANRRFDPRIAWFAAACIVFALRGQWLETFDLPVSPFLYEQINPLALWASALLTTASTLWLAGAMNARRGRLWVGLGAFALIGFAASLALPQLAGIYRTISFAGGFGLLLAMAWLLTSRARELGVANAVWLMAGYACVMIGGSHDLSMITGVLPAGWWTLLTPGFAVLLLCHMVVVGLYVLRSLGRAERVNEELERAISDNLQKLQASYATRQVLELERAGDSARAAERERLLRDMHDGLGAQLMTALRAAERGALGPAEMARSLQDGLDELRMLMDSTDLGQYLPAALATWRNRWDTRLDGAGVQLAWNVDESLDQVQLSSESALQVMRILQEAAANIVKHSRARNMTLDARVAATAAGKALQITITDDGVGLPPEAARPGARGMKNMRYRAEQMGAVLLIGAPEDGRGTRVSLNLPLGA